MKKVVVASLLACAAFVPGLKFAYAQQAVNLGQQATAAPCALPDAEYKAFTDASNATDPKAKAAALEAYLTAFPKSACPGITENGLLQLMNAYSQAQDIQKTLDTADRVLQQNPNNLPALYAEALIHKAQADALTDATAKQAALDAAAGYAQKAITALNGPKPDAMSDADFATLKTGAPPSLYSVIGAAALNKKDSPAAIDAYKKEIAAAPADATKTPGTVLQDLYFMAVAYFQSTPPDLLSCAFYASRVVAYAPDALKPQFAPTAKYCYHKYHDGDDGYDAFAAAAKDNLNPPDGLFAGIKPAKTPAEKIHDIIAGTPDLATLATSDKEMVFQYGSTEDAGKVWDTVKGKSFQFPDVLVIDNSTPNVLKVAVDDGAKQSKTADFTFNLTPLEEGTTAIQKAAAKKTADAITAATAVGKTVTLSGTYDSFTPTPIMITMKDGAVVLAKTAPKPAARPAAGAARRPATK